MSAADCPACDGLGCIPASPGERARFCQRCDGWGSREAGDLITLQFLDILPPGFRIDELAAKRHADALADQADADAEMRRER